MSSTALPAAPAPAGPPRLTAEEFAAGYNGEHVELVKGVVREVPMAGLEQGRICARMTILLGMHVEAHDLGHVMSNDSFVKTGPETVRGADVVFYSYERLPKGEPVPAGFHERAPDLVVEVKSPSDRWGDLFTRVGEYLKAGVRAAVVRDPGTGTASVYRSDELQQIFHNGDEVTLPDVLPGFSVPAARLFA